MTNCSGTNYTVRFPYVNYKKVNTVMLILSIMLIPFNVSTPPYGSLDSHLHNHASKSFLCQNAEQHKVASLLISSTEMNSEAVTETYCDDDDFNWKQRAPAFLPAISRPPV